MKNLNNRGFTLVEVIAAVVIISILLVLLIPNVSTLLNKGKGDAYDNLKQSILTAANSYVSDNRYDVVLESDVVTKIGNTNLIDSKITIGTLVQYGYLSSTGTDDDENEYIVDPRDRSKKLKLSDSYVIVTFNSSKKDYEFTIEDHYLSWE